MATTKNATYKRYNGTDWDTIYFATTAAQVGESSSRFFIKPSSNTVNGKQFTQTGGITLTGGDINYTGANGSYISNSSALDAALAALDSNLKSAADSLATITSAYSSGTIITTFNFQQKLYASNIYVDDDDNYTIQSRLDTIAALAEGKTSTYVLTAGTGTSSNFNGSFEQNKVDGASELHLTVYRTGSLAAGITTSSKDDVKFSSMKVGDIILTSGSGTKDWFYAGSTYYANATGSEGPYTVYHFYQIEADTPSLTSYATISYVDGKIEALDVSTIGGSQYYIKSVTETNGKISAEYGQISSSIANGSSNLATSGAVYSHVSARATKIFYADTMPTSGMIAGDVCIEY